MSGWKKLLLLRERPWQETAFLSFWSNTLPSLPCCTCNNSTQRKCCHQIVGLHQVFVSMCVHVCVCMCVRMCACEATQYPTPWKHSFPSNSLERKTVVLFLINLIVKYLVLKENCSHPAQALSESLWFVVWIHSHTCNSVSPQYLTGMDRLY